jgi:hypothetical protein
MVSIASVSDRKPAPAASIFSRMRSRSLSEREKTVEFPDDETVAGTQTAEHAVQLGPVPAAARGPLLEDQLASGGLEGVDLGSGVLILAFGDTRVSEEHDAVAQSCCRCVEFGNRSVRGSSLCFGWGEFSVAQTTVCAHPGWVGS